MLTYCVRAPYQAGNSGHITSKAPARPRQTGAPGSAYVALRQMSGEPSTSNATNICKGIRHGTQSSLNGGAVRRTLGVFGQVREVQLKCS